MIPERNEFQEIAGYLNLQDGGLMDTHAPGAKLIPINNSQFLALALNSIAEELEKDLYDDPYQIGWMAVTVNLSNLAAVGADPIGINILLNLPYATDSSFVLSIQNGIADACKHYKIPVFEGDIDQSNSFHISGAALGLISDSKTIKPTGIQIGDWLFCSGGMGYGAFYGYQKLIGKSKYVVEFFPRARLTEGKIIRQFGSSCMDTTSGFFPAVSNLSALNSVGFRSNLEVEEMVASWIRSTAENSGIPPWLLLAGPHGEFELLFTIPEVNLQAFESAARDQAWTPIKLGQAVTRPGLEFEMGGIRKRIDPANISMLYRKVGGDLNLYLEELLKIHRDWQ